MSDSSVSPDIGRVLDLQKANAAFALLASNPNTAHAREALDMLRTADQGATAVQLMGTAGLLGSGVAWLIARPFARADRANAGRMKARVLGWVDRANDLAAEAVPVIMAAMSAAQEWKSEVEPRLRALPRQHLPPNLRDIPGIDIGRVLDLLRTEGIPLYLVPRESIAAALLHAWDHATVRDVLSRRFDAILSDCEAVLDESRCAETSEIIDFAAEGIAALRAGHVAAAQALFAATLDSLVWSLPEPERLAVSKHKPGSDPEQIEARELRFALAFTPIWTAHEAFFPNLGDPIPRDFSRHASLHRVSRRQYSKRNALQALMLLSSVVGYLCEGPEVNSRDDRCAT